MREKQDEALAAQNLHLLRETCLARLYARADGSQQWVPRSVCDKTLKWPAKDGKPPVHQVDVQDWWLTKNPWPGEQARQTELI